jgi:hypothetical protein
MWIDRQDLLYTIRSARREPLLSIIAVVALSLGIGLNASVFTLLNAMFLNVPTQTNPASFVQIYPRSGNPRDALADILPTLTAGSDGDAVAVAHECFSNPVAAAPASLSTEPVGSQTAWLSVPLHCNLRATANRSRPQPPALNSRGPYPAPSRNCVRSAADPGPNSNRNRRTSFVFRMDVLLAGTLFSSLV